MDEIKFAYKGEGRLVRWSESGGAGRTITLQLDEEGDVHPFKHLPWGGENGQRMQIACVLVDDHEQPMAPEHAGRKKRTKTAPGSSNGRTPDFDSGNGGSSPSPGSKPKLRSNLAAVLCEENKEFRAWLYKNYRALWITDLTQNPDHSEQDTATSVLKRALKITSRTELDAPGHKADEFDRLTTSFAYRDQVRQ